MKHITFIIDYKARNNQGFRATEKILNWTEGSDKEKILFLLGNE